MCRPSPVKISHALSTLSLLAPAARPFLLIELVILFYSIPFHSRKKFPLFFSFYMSRLMALSLWLLEEKQLPVHYYILKIIFYNNWWIFLRLQFLNDEKRWPSACGSGANCAASNRMLERRHRMNKKKTNVTKGTTISTTPVDRQFVGRARTTKTRITSIEECGIRTLNHFLSSPFYLFSFIPHWQKDSSVPIISLSSQSFFLYGNFT